MKAAIYCRVSKEEQTTDNQTFELRAYAARVGLGIGSSDVETGQPCCGRVSTLYSKQRAGESSTSCCSSVWTGSRALERAMRTPSLTGWTPTVWPTKVSMTLG